MDIFDNKIKILSFLLCIYVYYSDTNVINNKIINKLFKQNNYNDVFIKYIKNNINLDGDYSIVTNNQNLKYSIYKSDNSKIIFINFRGILLRSVVKGFDEALLLLINSNVKVKFLNDNIGVNNLLYKELMCDDSFSYIINYIKKYKNYEIYISGHSKGAGLAIIATYLLSQEFENYNFNLITFGSIKPGNLDFSKKFNNLNNVKHNSIIDNRDVAVAFPYSVIKYHHVGNIIIYKSDDTTEYIDNDNGDFFSIKKFNNFKDHTFINYTNILCKLIK